MKVLLTGANGQLGTAIQSTKPKDVNLISSNRNTFDLTSKLECEKFLKVVKPDFILNAAAYTAVDKAESEKDLAFKINAQAPKNFAELANDLGFKLLHISTDFVFNGNQNTPYKIHQSRSPIGIYGYTKASGEEFIEKIIRNPNDGLILRTSWLMAPVGKNFALTMLKLMSERKELKVVCDQVGGPTMTHNLAEYCWKVIDLSHRGEKIPQILHYSNSGVASWYDIAESIKEIGLNLGILKKNINIIPIKSIDYPTPAKRPSYSVLDCFSSLDVLNLKSSIHWRKALEEVLQSYKIV